jgi:hypothetical protein
MSRETLAKIEEALKAVKERGAKDDYCPRCSSNNWLVDLLAIPAIALPNPMLRLSMAYSPPTGYIPVVSIMCANCGYTMFHNLNALGIVY